jgi:hypothetical protein
MFGSGFRGTAGTADAKTRAPTPRRQPSETTVAGAEDSQDLELITAAVGKLTLSRAWGHAPK